MNLPFQNLLSLQENFIHKVLLKKKTGNSGKIGIYNTRYTRVQIDRMIQSLLLQLLKRLSFNFYKDINLSKDSSV